MPHPLPPGPLRQPGPPASPGQAGIDLVGATWDQASNDLGKPASTGPGLPSWTKPPEARGGPLGPRLRKAPCQPAPGDLSDYGPAASELERRISKQKADLQEYIDCWIGRQDQLLEDLLLEAILARGSRPEVVEADGPASSPADEDDCEDDKFEITKAADTPPCLLESSPEEGVAAGRLDVAEKLSGEEHRVRLSAVQRKKMHHVTWNLLDDEKQRNRVLQANKASMSMLLDGAQPAQGSTDAKADTKNGGRVSEVSGDSQTPVVVKRSSMSVRTLITQVFQNADNRRKELAVAARKVFFQRNSLPSNTSLQETRSALEKVVKGPYFEKTIGFMILLSSVMVGAEVQSCAEAMTDTTPLWLEVMQTIFGFVFIVELILRMWVEGRGFWCSTEWQWNTFDAVVVSFSIVDKITSSIYEEGHPIMVFSGLIRIVRIVRIIRVVRFLRELRLMILSIYHTLKSLLWSLVLMFLMMYLFSTYLTQATTTHLLSLDHFSPEHQKLVDYWGTLPRTAYTLFLCMSGGVSWGDPVAGLWDMHWSVVAVFLVYIAFTLFAFLNVITGFFCVSASDLANVDKDQIVQEQLKNKTHYTDEFKSIFSMMDVDQSGDISLQELEDMFEDPRLAAYFSHLNLDIDKAWDIFKLLDDDGSGTVSIEEFVLGCLKLRGAAKSIDVAALGYDVKRLKRTLSDFMYFVEGSFQDLVIACAKLETRSPTRKLVNGHTEKKDVTCSKEATSNSTKSDKQVRFAVQVSSADVDLNGACV